MKKMCLDDCFLAGKKGIKEKKQMLSQSDQRRKTHQQGNREEEVAAAAKSWEDKADKLLYEILYLCMEVR